MPMILSLKNPIQQTRSHGDYSARWTEVLSSGGRHFLSFCKSTLEPDEPENLCEETPY